MTGNTVSVPVTMIRGTSNALLRAAGRKLINVFNGSVKMAYSYSFNEKDYTGSFETREAAITAAHAENEGYYREFWTAKNRPPDILAAIDGGRFIEEVTELNDDFQIEQGEDWPNCHNGQRDDLTEMLRQTFQAWVLKHNLTPTFWIADDVKRHEFEEAD